MRKKEEIRRSVDTGAILTAALVCLWPAWTTFAQPEAEPAIFGESVDVQLIDVEVWVTDRQGNAVAGLGVDDFEIREDGKKVVVSNFAEIRNPPAAATEPPETIDAAASSGSELRFVGATPASPGTGGEGYLVLYVDELFSGPTGREQLIADLRAFFADRRVPPDRVLILRQDKQLEVEAKLGSTQTEIEAALERLEQPSSLGAQTWADEKLAFDRLLLQWEKDAVHRRLEPPLTACDVVLERLVRDVQPHVELSRLRIEETLGHLADAASFLGGLAGPKTLVYVSDGLPTTPGGDLMSFIKHLCPDRPVDRRLDTYHGLNESFRRLSRHANANRVTIYTMQATGLRERATDSSASQRGLHRTTELLDRYESESRIQQRQGLLMLADETGGRAVVNRNRLVEDLERIAEDMRGYYSLAYEPLHGGDGLEHRIEVRLRRDGGDKLRVRHRPGYRDKSLDQRMFERLESTLYLDLMENPLAVRLGAGEVVPGEKSRSTVPFHVQVPVDRITFLNYLGMERASFRVLALARDEDSGKTAFKEEHYRLTRPLPPVPDQQVSLVFELELGEGVHVIALGVRDEATKEASFVSTSLEILAPGAATGGG